MNAKQHFQLVNKARSATGGGPVERLNAGEDGLYEVLQDSAAFTGLNEIVTSDNTNET